MRDEIEAFLRLWGEPTAAEVRLWCDILAPMAERVVPALTEWARQSDQRPHPRQLINLSAESAATGDMRKIAAGIAGGYGLTVSDLRSNDRHIDIVHPRQHVMFALREAGFSMTRIGQFLRRDHTTVMYGARAHEKRVGVGAGN